MALVTFDGPNKIIQIPSLGDYDVSRDIYSAWKDWVRQSDNAKFAKAFDTTGGDSIGGGQTIAPYFFLRNDLGWQIRAPEDNGQVRIVGQLFPRDALTDYIVQAQGFDALILQEVSTRAIVVETGTSGLTAEESTQLSLINGIQSLVDELHKLQGLDINNPMTVTPTSRNVGDITQTLSGDGETTTTVTRTA